MVAQKDPTAKPLTLYRFISLHSILCIGYISHITQSIVIILCFISMSQSFSLEALHIPTLLTHSISVASVVLKE